METRRDQFKRIQAEGLEIFERKNRDYGDSFAEDGVLGVMIRMKDKLNRFITLARTEGERACKDEALRDTLIDLHNYAAMAVICHEEGSPWEPHPPTQAEIEDIFRRELFAGMEGGMDGIVR